MSSCFYLVGLEVGNFGIMLLLHFINRIKFGSNQFEIVSEAGRRSKTHFGWAVRKVILITEFELTLDKNRN